MNQQPGILPGIPRVARYLSFSVRTNSTKDSVLQSLRTLAIDNRCVVGVGAPLILHCGGSLEKLRTFPPLSGPGVQIPSTQHALWCWLRGDDQGELVNRGNSIVAALSGTLQLEHVVDGFKYGDGEFGLDLTGYEDGTENPVENEAVKAALLQGSGAGLDGSSFVAVQQWSHDLATFNVLPGRDQDDIIGRRKSDNEELENPPASAHTKRTEQESFDPEAFVLRRSMPWATASGQGLVFVAFGHSLDAFEAQLTRMAGLEDGIPDALFRFSQPINGSYYWCPPVVRGKLDISALGAFAI